DIDSVCGGRALCARCQVVVGVGSFPKHGIESRPDHVGGETEAEVSLRQRNRKFLAGRRLSCQAVIQGDLVIDVPADSQVHKQVVRKRAEARAIELDPVITLHYVEVEQPDMHDPAGHFERLKRALAREWGLGELTADLQVLQSLHGALTAGEFKVTVAVRGGNRMLHVEPGFHDRLFGLAIDVGSTTIAAHLCNLQTGEVVAAAGAMNPQIRFGEDLMSRVSYVMMNPGGDKELTRVVREAIQALAEETAKEAGVALSDILEVVLVGNPIMHHLFLGIDPTPLGGAPFPLATDGSIDLWASELDLRLNRDTRAYVLPCIAGHVGADAAGVVLSESPHHSDELMLAVDVGTNAEIILGNKKRVLACSSPTGPAFEGAQISCGQRAAPGAIERLRVDRVTFEPRFKVIGCEAWSDEPGFNGHVTGVCGSGIIEAIAEMYLAGVINQDGVFDGTLAERSSRVFGDGRTFSYLVHDGEPRLVITQNDVRQIQLAKAALYAGARLLMDHMGVEAVDRIVLAGAFGSHIDVLYAMVLGMIPDCDLAKVSAAGNAAGTGARIALLNKQARTEIETVVHRIEKVETAIEPRFQEHFVNAMALPHKCAPYPNLQRKIALPAPKAAAGSDAGPRRRRRDAP
ncbi:MAG: ASKHA domain-containing protein, partial [Alphaproteobacteria bacterium]